MPWMISHYINLDKPYKNVSHLEDVLLVPGSDRGHVWHVTVENDSGPVDLSSYTVTAKFQRFPDGNQFEILGDASGNVAQVVFNSLVYTVPGLLRGVLFVSKDAQEIPLVEAYFDVRDNFTGDVTLNTDQIVYYPDAGKIVYDGANYVNVSGVTATETDVRDGKTFVRADGTLTEGNASFDATITGGTVTATLISGDDYELTIS
jgi:hypothetical protein